MTPLPSFEIAPLLRVTLSPVLDAARLSQHLCLCQRLSVYLSLVAQWPRHGQAGKVRSPARRDASFIFAGPLAACPFCWYLSGLKARDFERSNQKNIWGINLACVVARGSMLSAASLRGCRAHTPAPTIQGTWLRLQAGAHVLSGHKKGGCDTLPTCTVMCSLPLSSGDFLQRKTC